MADPAKEITNAYVQRLADELFAKHTPYRPMSDREVCETAARLLNEQADLMRVMTATFKQSAARNEQWLKEHANG